MNISLRGDKVTITKAMEEYATEKLSKLNKYIEEPESVKATVIVKVNKDLHKVEVTMPLKSLILRAEEEKTDFYAAMDVVLDKLERQIRKNKTRLSSKKMKDKKEFVYAYIEDIEETEEKIVKRKKIEVKPMDEEEAILQMELLGHQFYLYKDAETNQPTVVYKRKDGNYGVIEAE
ncbi:MAG: ribosome-associated translation inhibitor RaiA [Bacilli bacterium]|nr:ribosome-associated translation inhibitor RaiA [Bacilli bacterium]